MILAAIAALAFSAQAQIEGTINVGDWDGASAYNGSYFDMAPTNFYLAHTGCQMIYTPDLLADMEGKENVKITGLKFKFYSESFEEISRNMKVYLQETDATEFAKNDQGIKQFFEFGEPLAETEIDIDLLENYGEDVILEFPVDFAFTPGKSLLVTMVFDAEDDDNCTTGSDYAPFYTSGISSKAMLYTNNNSSFLEYAQGTDWPNSTASLGCGTNVELPVTEISYTMTMPEENEDPTFEEMYVVGTFNGWSQEEGMVELVADDDNHSHVGTVELEAGAEFKIITPYGEGWKWFGGIDENNVGYFLINDEIINDGINEIYLLGDANFKVDNAGNYTITVYVDYTTKEESLGGYYILWMNIIKNDPEAITTVGVGTKNDNAYYNLMGVKFNSMPSVPGIYIHNGKTVVIK